MCGNPDVLAKTGEGFFFDKEKGEGFCVPFD
jgi:hypothetical protein